MKENIYRTSSDWYTATYALILVFAMLLVVIVATALKYHRTRTQFVADKKALKVIQMQGSFIKPAGIPTSESSSSIFSQSNPNHANSASNVLFGAASAGENEGQRQALLPRVSTNIINLPNNNDD